MRKTIGVLTGGGDVPGLNTIIRDITYRAMREKGFRVLGIRRGWDGLVYMNPEQRKLDPEHVIELNEDNVRRRDREGGTFLHTDRVQPSCVECDNYIRKFRGLHFSGKRDMTSDVLKNLDKAGIDALVAIGGDDTLIYARHITHKGFPVFGIPKTMDGDVAALITA